jgi:2,3-bisphosphoglycerate-independent phosphoglycerate mutase
MKHILLLFMDGVGLGEPNPEINPLSIAKMPALEDLLDGRRLIASSAPVETKRATLLSLDARLGVAGLPQSATGQATLLKGINIAASVGAHFGPKPNQSIARIISENNLFKELKRRNLTIDYLNAFPPPYFETIASARRLPGTIALAALRAGVPLHTADTLNQGKALSADFTAQGWRERLKLTSTPFITYLQAGERLAQLSQQVNFALFEYWLTDYAGHGQNMPAALDLLSQFDRVLQALLENWRDETGLVVITSDHGNLEDLSTRRHTENSVPCLIIGTPELRHSFASGLVDLTGITPAVLRFFQ